MCYLTYETNASSLCFKVCAADPYKTDFIAVPSFLSQPEKISPFADSLRQIKEWLDNSHFDFPDSSYSGVWKITL